MCPSLWHVLSAYQKILLITSKALWIQWFFFFFHQMFCLFRSVSVVSQLNEQFLASWISLESSTVNIYVHHGNLRLEKSNLISIMILHAKRRLFGSFGFLNFYLSMNLVNITLLEWLQIPSMKISLFYFLPPSPFLSLSSYPASPANLSFLSTFIEILLCSKYHVHPWGYKCPCLGGTHIECLLFTINHEISSILSLLPFTTSVLSVCCILISMGFTNLCQSAGYTWLCWSCILFLAMTIVGLGGIEIIEMDPNLIEDTMKKGLGVQFCRIRLGRQHFHFLTCSGPWLPAQWLEVTSVLEVKALGIYF